MPRYNVTVANSESKRTKVRQITAPDSTTAARLMLEQLERGYPQEFARGIFDVTEVDEQREDEPQDEPKRFDPRGRR